MPVGLVDMPHIILALLEDHAAFWAFIENLTIPVMDFKCLQNRHPLGAMDGGPAGIRTRDRRLRRPAPYPARPRALELKSR